jgi:PAS domain-containing protein
MQEDLSSADIKLESSAKNLPGLVARFDSDMRHVYVNAAIERLT